MIMRQRITRALRTWTNGLLRICSNTERKTAYAKVELVTPAGTICKVCKKSLKNEMKETMNDEK